MIKTKSPWTLGIASAVMSLSLVACVQSSLEAKIRKDGSIDFVASGQVTQTSPGVQAGISIDENQGISIDPTAIEAGSMHIRILLSDGSDSFDGDNPGASGSEDAAESGDGDMATTKDTDAKGDNAQKDGTATTNKETKSDALSSTLTGAILASATKPATDNATSNATPGKVVFDRTLSALDDNSEILTVTDAEEGYYLIHVTTDHATGTVKIRPYDLSTKEIIDRDSKKMMNETRDFFNGLFGDGEEVAKASEAPSNGTDETPEDTPKDTEDATSEKDGR